MFPANLDPPELILSQDTIEMELREVVLSLLRPATLFLLLLHTLLILSYPFQNSWPLWGQRVMVTGLTAFCFLAGYFLIRLGWVAADHVYPFAALVLALPIVADTAGNYYFTRDPLVLSFFLITAVIFGYFALDWRWLLFIQLVNIFASLFVVLLVGELVVELVPYAGTLTAALLAGVFLHIAHRRSLIRMLVLRHAEKRARETAEILQQSGASLTSSLSTTGVLEGVLENLAHILACDRFSVLLKEGDYLVIMASRGFPPELPDQKDGRIFIGDAAEDGIFPQIYRTQRSLHITDVRSQGDWIYLPRVDPARVWLGIPLIYQGEVIGILSLVRLRPAPFAAEEISRAETFANQAAIALKNAQLYEQVARFNQNLELEVEARTEDLQQAFEQLEKLDQAKGDFINIMSHEIRTPLTVLRGYTQILARDEGVAADQRLRSYVDGLNMGSLRLQELVDSLFLMVKLDNHTLEAAWTEFAAADLIKLVIGELEEFFSARQQTVIIEPGLEALPPLVADYDLLRHVFTNLLLNGIKYTPDGGSITFTGREQTTAVSGRPVAGVEITVSDTGIGIPLELQELIFTKFFQTGKIDLHSSSKIKFKGGGAGLGLSIATAIVALHHGRIRVESEGQNEQTLPGSRFFVWLPLTQDELG